MISNSNKFISILICCYNSEKFIEFTLRSIINQNYKNYEIIIIDDGSEDNTKKLIYKMLKGINFTYHFQKNQGLSSARNNGIKLAKSDLIFIIDHDDLMTESRLNDQLIEISKNQDYALYFGDTYLNNNKITKFDLYKKLYKIDLKNIKKISDNSLLRYGCFIGSSTVVINKKLTSSIFFDKQFSYVSDFDYFLAVSINNKIFKSNNIYSHWSEKEKQISFINKAKNYFELIQMYNKYIFYKIKYLKDIRIFATYINLYFKFFYHKISKI